MSKKYHYKHPKHEEQKKGDSNYLQPHNNSQSYPKKNQKAESPNFSQKSNQFQKSDVNMIQSENGSQSNRQDIEKFFHELKNIKGRIRKQQIMKNDLPFLNDEKFKDELSKAKTRYDKQKDLEDLTYFFENRYNSIFQDFDKQSSTKQKQNILIGSALYLTMEQFVPSESKQNYLDNLKILQENYFISLYDSLMQIKSQAHIKEVQDIKNIIENVNNEFNKKPIKIQQFFEDMEYPVKIQDLLNLISEGVTKQKLIKLLNEVLKKDYNVDHVFESQENLNPELPHQDFMEKVRNQKLFNLQNFMNKQKENSSDRNLNELKIIFGDIFNNYCLSSLTNDQKMKNLGLIQNKLKELSKIFRNLNENMKGDVVKCIQDLKVQYILPAELKHDFIVELVYQCALKISQKSIDQINLQIDSDELLQNEIYKRESQKFKSLDNNIDKINERFDTKFPILFKDNLINISYDNKKSLLIGCAIFLKIEDSIRNKLRPPKFFAKKRIVEQLKNLKIEEANQRRFYSIINEAEEILRIKNNEQKGDQYKIQGFLKNIDNHLEYIRGRDFELITNVLKQFYVENKIQYDQNRRSPSENPGDIDYNWEKNLKENPTQTIKKLFENKRNIDQEDFIRQINEIFELTFFKNFTNQDLKDEALGLKNHLKQLQEAEKGTNQRQKDDLMQSIKKDFEYLSAYDDIENFQTFMHNYTNYLFPKLKIEKIYPKKVLIKRDFSELNYMLPTVRKYNIEDFMTIYSTQFINNNRLEMQEQFMKNTHINGYKLVILLFDCIKRRKDFQEVIEIFQKIKEDVKISQIGLFTYLYIHAEDQLKTYLFISCSQYMAIPVTALNPWNLDEETKMAKRIVFKEAFYPYEKNKAVFQFKYLQNEQSQNVHGCSILMNKMFGKSFQKKNKYTTLNEGSIEMQFDYNCTKTQFLTVADAHGFIEDQLIENISILFDCIIIHTDQEYQDNQKLQNLIKQLKTKKKEQQFIIVHHDQQSSQVIQNKIDQNIIQLQFKDIQERIKEKLLIMLQQIFNFDSNQYLSNIDLRLNNKKKFLDFLGSFKIQQQVQSKQFEMIQYLLKQLISLKDYNSEEFLPMINLSRQHNDILKILQREQNLNDKQVSDFRGQLQDLENKMKVSKFSPIVKIFQNIIYDNIQLEVFPILAQYIKSFLQNAKEPLEEKLNLLNQQRIQNKNEEIKDKIQEEIDDINKLIKQKTFSLELILREIYYFSHGQPLELIDGDTLQYIKNIYEGLFQESDIEDVLVVSVVGVQSSGKSLLLNFLFGTQFVSSAGRCTKGVYASILQYKTHKTDQKNKKKILLLDTEGIQSPGARDEQFDRKIVYYILSISHVVLICNKQEMNREMVNVIHLVADGLVNAKQQYIHRPDIYLILNMLTEIQSDTKNECIRKLHKDLIQINDQKNVSLNEIIKIDSENVIPLKSAFNETEFGPDNKYSVKVPKNEFQRDLQRLREKILKKFSQMKESTQLSMNQWLKLSQHLWQYTNQLRDLEIFSNLKQKKDDKTMIKIIDKLVNDFYETQWQQKIKVFVNCHLEQTLQTLQGGESIPFHILQQKIMPKINDYYQEISQNIQKKFIDFCSQNEISKNSYEKRIYTLNQKNEFYKKKVELYCAQNIQLFVQEKTRNVGDCIMQNITIEFMKKKQNYKVQEAENEFEKYAWKKVLQKSKEVLSTPEELEINIYNLVQNEFQQSIHTQNENIKYICDEAYKQSSILNYTMEKIIQSMDQSKILLFTGDLKAPDTNKLHNYINQINLDKYLSLPENIFIREEIYEYYQWHEALKQIMNKQYLANDISAALLQFNYNQPLSFDKIKKKYYINKKEIETPQRFNREQWNYNKIDEIIQKLKIQLKKIGIDYRGSYDAFIPPEYFEKKLKYKGFPPWSIIKKQIEFIIDNQIFKFKPIRAPDQDLQDQQAQNDLLWLKDYNYKQFIIKTPYLIKSDDYFFLSKKQKIVLTQEMKQQIKSTDKQILISLDKYFEFLFEYNFDLIEFQSKKHSQYYFWSLLNKDKIFRQIENCILKNYCKNKQQNRQLFEIMEILKKQDQESIEMRNDFHLFQPKRTKEVIKGINQIIDEINKELENFCLTISDEGTYLIFLLAQSALSALTFQLQLIENDEPLRILENNKQNEKKMFVAKLTDNDGQIDETLAEKFYQQFIQQSFLKSQELANSNFKEQMYSLQDKFNHVNEIKEFEQECLKICASKKKNPNFIVGRSEEIAIKNLVKYKFNPKILLQEKFDQKYDQQSKKIIKDCLENQKNNFYNKIEKLKQYFQEFKTKIERNALQDLNASVLFIIDQSSPMQRQDLNNEKILKKFQQTAQMQYLYEMIEQKWDSGKIIKLNYQNNQVWLKKDRSKIMPSYFDFDTKFYNDTQKLILSNLNKGDQINNLYNFIKKFLDILQDNSEKQSQKQLKDKAEQYFSKNGETELKENCKLKLQNLLIGCPNYCPLCKKQCDVQHLDNEQKEDRIHQCIHGHQLQAFGGSKTFDDNTAVLQSCDDIKENQILRHNGIQVQWRKFKEQHINWKFNKLDTQEKLFNRQKNVDLWNLIGKNLCDQYNEQKINPIDIVYKDASMENQVKITQNHFVMMLDNSSSMSGKKQEDLKNQLKIFFKKLQDDDELKQNSWVTVINYSQKAEKIFEQQVPRIDLIDQIGGIKVGTNFNEPLIMAHQIISQSKEKYDKIILYFMSDGHAQFPHQGIDLLLSEQELVDKIEFYSIAYGSKAQKPILKQMVDKFPNGQLIDAPDAEALAQSFMEIVPNIYQ